MTVARGPQEPRAPARYEARHPGRRAAAGKSRGLTVDAAASAARPSAGHGGAPRGRRGSRVAAARARTPAPTSASREGRGSAPPRSCPPRFAAVQRLRATLRGGGRCRALTAEGVAGRTALGSRPGPAGRAEDGCPERRGQSRARALPPRAPSRAGPVRDPAAGAAPGACPPRGCRAARPGTGAGGRCAEGHLSPLLPLTRARGSGARSGGNLLGGDLHQVGLLGMRGAPVPGRPVSGFSRPLGAAAGGGARAGRGGAAWVSALPAGLRLGGAPSRRPDCSGVGVCTERVAAALS